jgi:hypothetical protein
MRASLRSPPESPRSFAFEGFEIDDASGEVRLRYGYDNGLRFCERIDFQQQLPSRASPLRRGFEAALAALHVAAGVSYYKAFAPAALILPDAGFTSAQREFFRALYVDGLGEFAYRNGIDIARRVNFLAPGAEQAPKPAATDASPGGLPRCSAVLIGGGKDSLVSVEILRAAREPILLFAVNPKGPIADCARASGLPFVSARRELDARLFALNDAGALNGHVPVTAIVSFIALAAAFVHGYDAVVLSNERSADEGNVIHDGREINHQYSKTATFERAMRGYVMAQIDPELNYFSLLRPLSELHIARLMARTSRYDAGFTSCNRAFRLRPGADAVRWCRDCPKCRFAFLILATAMSPERLRGIFGANLLDVASQIPGYEELVGLAGHKPWECVGEIAESSAAMLSLASQPAWANSTVLERLAPRLRKLMPRPDDVLSGLLTPSREHCLPPRFEGMLDAYLAAR